MHKNEMICYQRISIREDKSYLPKRLLGPKELLRHLVPLPDDLAQLVSASAAAMATRDSRENRDRRPSRVVVTRVQKAAAVIATVRRELPSLAQREQREPTRAWVHPSQW